ncbi:MAG: response regulator transcription factor [Burkholderiales bacterium]
MTEGINVLVVDDHPMVLEYLRAAVLRALPGAGVRTAESLAGALEEAGRYAFGLVLLDLGLPGCAGIDSVLRFRDAHPTVPVLVVSANSDSGSIRAALAAGVAGFVPKSASVPVLLNALRLVAEGGRYVPPEILSELEPGQAGAAVSPEGRLTNRQREVLAHTLTGQSNAQIAKALDIEKTTVRQHAHAVYSAFGVSTRAELMAAARPRKAGSG